jgi:CheY-like chemotaxis protein
MSRANAMIVDDDRDLAESLTDLLEMSGCCVTTAANGKEAVLGHGQQDFSVTFMAVRMPGQGGLASVDGSRRVDQLDSRVASNIRWYSARRG